MKLYLQIVTYNHRGVKVGRKLMKICIRVFIIGAILGLILEKLKLLNVDSGIGEIILVSYSLTLIVTMYFASLKIGYHQNKLEKKGQIELEVDHTLIKYEGIEIELNNPDFSIFFVDEGYEGKSNWNSLTGAGALVKDSGINKIAFKNAEQNYEYEILITNFRQMDALKDILLEIENKKANN